MYYAVARGRVSGIYTTWEDCLKQVNGYSGAKYKKFKELNDAINYMERNEEKDEILDVVSRKKMDEKILKTINKSFTKTRQADPNDIEAMEDYKVLKENEVIVYVDGSYNDVYGEFTYGAVIINHKGEIVELSGIGDQEEDALKSTRNVAGELKGSLKAIDVAQKLGYNKVYLHYDYEGIEKWCTGKWAANKVGTKLYQDKMNLFLRVMDITFIKVKGHSGVKYNEIADALATRAYDYHDY